METTLRHKSNLLDTLTQQSKDYDFFQAVRLLKYKLTDDLSCEFRFKSKLALAFPTTQIDKIASEYLEATERTRFNIFLTFMGLSGQNAVLPDHYTEMLLEQSHEKDGSLEDFFDIFNHRVISLFYETWEKSNFFATLEQENNIFNKNKLLQLIRSLTGETPYLNKKHLIAPNTLLFYSGLLAKQTRSTDGLNIVLQDYFQLSTNIKPFQGIWFNITPEQASCLSYQHKSEDRHNILGKDSMLGKRIWHAQNSFTIEIDSLGYKKLSQLLPNGSMLKEIKNFVYFYVGKEFYFTINLLVKPEEIIPSQLKHKKSFCLGWNSWLKAYKAKKYQSTIRPYDTPKFLNYSK